MLCTNCSKRVRPIVACDIDGVLGDYHGHIHHFAGGYFGGGRDLANQLDGYDGSMTHGEWFERCGISRIEFRAMKLAYRQGAMKRTMGQIHGSISALQRIARQGVEIWLTTTRPYLRLDNIDPDTRFWLDRNEVPYDYMLYDESKYQELAQRVDRSRVVVVVDDVDEMYDDAEAVFGRAVPILLKRVYNRAVERPNQAYSGKDLMESMMARLQNYERTVG